MINNVNDGYYVAMEVKTVSKYYNMDTICKFTQFKVIRKQQGRLPKSLCVF